ALLAFSKENQRIEYAIPLQVRRDYFCTFESRLHLSQENKLMSVQTAPFSVIAIHQKVICLDFSESH
ncbi:hypothetical protein P3682_24315, partial [Vibrio parahaemolyticus]|nr:hypothetical protein [Vibrio parahaemolyticus]